MKAISLSRLAAWMFIAALAMLGFSFLLPYIVSHKGERPMIDAPGVLIDGHCCVEAPWHFIQRLLWLPVAPGLLLISITIYLVALVRRPKKPTD